VPLSTIFFLSFFGCAVQERLFERGSVLCRRSRRGGEVLCCGLRSGFSVSGEKPRGSDLVCGGLLSSSCKMNPE
jgi:hypothetical protein